MKHFTTFALEMQKYRGSECYPCYPGNYGSDFFEGGGTRVTGYTNVRPCFMKMKNFNSFLKKQEF